MTELLTGQIPIDDQFEQYRVELTGYCYRMLGSAFEAEDAVQDTMVRAWRNQDQFEGRSSVRSWLYRIATNVCLTMLDGRHRRPRPIDLGPSSTADTPIGPQRPEIPWLEPIPDSAVMPSAIDPADAIVLRETIRLAFVSALQELPPRQRAVLILREVLHWKAEEVATFLESSVASVNSALQRARATLDSNPDRGPERVNPTDQQRALVKKYADAFERYDMDSLVALLHRDVVMSMPPYELWLQGSDQVLAWLQGQGHGCEGSRVVLTQANGSFAYGQYRKDPSGGHQAWALAVLDLDDHGIKSITSFLDTARYFPMFGLPLRLD